MLTARIIHDCIRKLLTSNPSDEEALECLCRLLTTVGQALDKETNDRLAKGPIQGLVDLGSYFKEMMKLVEQKKTSARVRFLMQDVIELRLNGWKKRREDAGPKTIDQIHKEAQNEELKQKMANMRDTRDPPPPSRKSEDRSSQRRYVVTLARAPLQILTISVQIHHWAERDETGGLEQYSHPSSQDIRET